MLLKDKMLYGQDYRDHRAGTDQRRVGLKKSVALIKPMFENMNDPYLQDRAEDIVHVSDRIMKHLIGSRRSQHQ